MHRTQKGHRRQKGSRARKQSPTPDSEIPSDSGEVDTDFDAHPQFAKPQKGGQRTARPQHRSAARGAAGGESRVQSGGADSCRQSEEARSRRSGSGCPQLPFKARALGDGSGPAVGSRTEGGDYATSADTRAADARADVRAAEVFDVTVLDSDIQTMDLEVVQKIVDMMLEAFSIKNLTKQPERTDVVAWIAWFATKTTASDIAVVMTTNGIPFRLALPRENRKVKILQLFKFLARKL